MPLGLYGMPLGLRIFLDPDFLGSGFFGIRIFWIRIFLDPDFLDPDFLDPDFLGSGFFWIWKFWFPEFSNSEILKSQILESSNPKFSNSKFSNPNFQNPRFPNSQILKSSNPKFQIPGIPNPEFQIMRIWNSKFPIPNYKFQIPKFQILTLQGNPFLPLNNPDYQAELRLAIRISRRQKGTVPACAHKSPPLAVPWPHQRGVQVGRIRARLDSGSLSRTLKNSARTLQDSTETQDFIVLRVQNSNSQI